MTDDLPTVWPAEAHTFAKHAILENYLKAWFPILSHQSHHVARGSEEILFIDGFAGSGEYSGGEWGSPVIALDAALKHSTSFPTPVRFFFIEEREDRCRHLQQILDERYSEPQRQSRNIRWSPPEQGKCDAVLAAMLDQCERRGVRFGPALAFLDQFGYSAVSMKLIERILAYPQCEVFAYIDYKDMNRWITDETKAPTFTRTYGGDEWREAVTMSERDRRAYLLEAYQRALKSRANARYVYAFAMFDKVDRPLYWLVFCTNHLRGLELMKWAMWKVDKTGRFKFSDRDNPDQLTLLDQAFDQRWLAEKLAGELAGKEMTAAKVKEHVLTETPCYLFREALRTLETASPPGLQIVQSPKTRRRGSFPDDDLEKIVVRFTASRLF